MDIEKQETIGEKIVSSKTRIAWVTGGGTGIGKAGAAALLADGWTVVISGRRADVLKGVADELGAGGKPVEAMALDVSNADDVNKVAQAILARHGRIDLLVNSAGVNLPKRSWEDVTQDGWDQIVDINLNGVMYCMRAVLPAMRAQKDGCIINVASWAGRIVSKMTRAGLYGHQTCRAGADAIPSTWTNASTACAPAVSRPAKSPLTS